jgi:hypothetical protein
MLATAEEEEAGEQEERDEGDDCAHLHPSRRGGTWSAVPPTRPIIVG